MKIGNIEIGRVALGPMAGVTDLPFRVLCKEKGADLIYTEMVSSKGIHFNNQNTKDLLRVDASERPAAIQLFGSEPEIMAETAKRIEELPFDFYDINMGCPVPKVVNNHEGSALMLEPQLAGRIVEAMVKAVKKPVFAKFRAGFDPEHVNAPEFAHVLEESGAKLVAVHGRTRVQYYSGKADWDIIRRVKESVKIPVIGNGDITCGRDAARMILTTGCDMVMIGRAAQGNPWIFGQVGDYLKLCAREAVPGFSLDDKGNVILDISAELVERNRGLSLEELNELLPKENYERPSFDEVFAMIKRHAKGLEAMKGEDVAVRELRKHVAWYTEGYPHSAKLRREVNLCTDMESLMKELETYKEDLERFSDR